MTRHFPDVSPLYEARALTETDLARRAMFIGCARHGCERLPVVNREPPLFRLRHGPSGEGITVDSTDREEAIALVLAWTATLHERRPTCVPPWCSLHPHVDAATDSNA